ncbi:MAG TPA: ATP-binding cassette domain-containing protein [Cytophagaceae bacterium]|nr:ATP-binding cassette domain-containing protein [Cytophagaceae bacterium]
MSFSTEPVASVKDLSIFYEKAPTLSDINFEINKGEFVYLIGRTGSGKSSLLKTLYADLPVYEGSATVAGYKLEKIKKSEVPYLRRKIGIIFQDFQLLNDRSIGENLIFVMKATGWKDNSKIKQRLSDVLMRVGLEAATDKMPHQLSGGEQQRIVIARALINEPTLLIADEPTGNLDPEVAEGILKLFLEINKTGTTILMATHNHAFLDRYPARVLKVENTTILDSAKEVFSFSFKNV